MITVAVILLAWVVWVFIGMGVLAAVDKDGSLLEWFSSAPNTLLQGMVLLAWPVVALLHVGVWRNDN